METSSWNQRIVAVEDVTRGLMQRVAALEAANRALADELAVPSQLMAERDRARASEAQLAKECDRLRKLATCEHGRHLDDPCRDCKDAHENRVAQQQDHASLRRTLNRIHDAFQTIGMAELYTDQAALKVVAEVKRLRGMEPGRVIVDTWEALERRGFRPGVNHPPALSTFVAGIIDAIMAESVLAHDQAAQNEKRCEELKRDRQTERDRAKAAEQHVEEVLAAHRAPRAAGCCYCDAKSQPMPPGDQAGWCRNHVETECPNHPLRQHEKARLHMIDEIKRGRTRNNQAREIIEHYLRQHAICGEEEPGRGCECTDCDRAREWIGRPNRPEPEFRGFQVGDSVMIATRDGKPESGPHTIKQLNCGGQTAQLGDGGGQEITAPLSALRVVRRVSTDAIANVAIAAGPDASAKDPGCTCPSGSCPQHPPF